MGLSRATDGPEVAIASHQERHTMQKDSLAQLRIIWQNAGRLGQAKFRAAAQRKGRNLFVRGPRIS